MIFEYMTTKEKHWIGIQLGNYVSLLVYENTIEELNKLDRLKLAKNWYFELHPFYKKTIKESLHGTDLFDFLEEVAIWIDERIPKAYKKRQERNGKGPAGQSIRCDKSGNIEYGFIYHYDYNLRNIQIKSKEFPREKIVATEKQLSYLDILADKYGYNRRNTQMTVKEASAFIDYFKNSLAGEEPVRFNECFKEWN